VHTLERRNAHFSCRPFRLCQGHRAALQTDIGEYEFAETAVILKEKKEGK
jgi:hypothetical protein